MSVKIVEAKDLTRRYGYRTALKKITFDIKEGGILALFGANGAGKTTLMRIIATLLRPHGGMIKIFGHDPEDDPISIRSRLGLIGDKPLLYPELSGRENLHFFGKLYGMESISIEQRAEELSSQFGVRSWLDEPTKNLSTGLRKRFDIIRTVLHNPDLLLLDEPYAGLDIESTEIFSGYLGQARSHKTAILTTHNIALGTKISDSFITLRKGEIVGQGDISEFDGKL
ncbi:MAG: ABC transporter ATP-binding protein [Candidatus Thorarchaeota archaeon]